MCCFCCCCYWLLFFFTPQCNNFLFWLRSMFGNFTKEKSKINFLIKTVSRIQTYTEIFLTTLVVSGFRVHTRKPENGEKNNPFLTQNFQIVPRSIESRTGGSVREVQPTFIPACVRLMYIGQIDGTFAVLGILRHQGYPSGELRTR